MEKTLDVLFEMTRNQIHFNCLSTSYIYLVSEADYPVKIISKNLLDNPDVIFAMVRLVIRKAIYYASNITYMKWG